MAQSKLRPPDAKFFKTLYDLGLGALVGRLIVLVVTTGRKSGKPRLTALQYEEIEGKLYLGSSLGLKADWVKNLLANPLAEIRLKNRRWQGRAEVVSEPGRVADFIAYRLKKHPRLIGRILQMDGISAQPSRAELEAYAGRLALVIITPVEN